MRRSGLLVLSVLRRAGTAWGEGMSMDTPSLLVGVRP